MERPDDISTRTSSDCKLDDTEKDACEKDGTWACPDCNDVNSKEVVYQKH